MADTTLRPRPHFGTFLHSDTNAGGDGLSFYEYKKLLRSKKVALLQERRARSYEPGYKKDISEAKPSSKKDEGDVPRIVEAQTQTEIIASRVGEPSVPERVNGRPVTVSFKEKAPGQVLSARAHTRRGTWPDDSKSQPCATYRPATAGPGRPARAVTDSKLAAADQQTVPIQKLWLERQQHAATSPVAKEDTHRPLSRISIRDVALGQMDTGSKPDPADVQSLVNSYCWTSATHKSYSDIQWENKLPASLPTPDPATTLCNRPDSVSLKFAMRRMEMQPQNWQNLGSAWDFVQARKVCYRRPTSKNLFCSPCRNTQHIPGYLGHIPGVGRVERAEGDYRATTQILVRQPRPTSISRKANIPGYSGCTHWNNMLPAHAVMEPPYSTTHLRVHREFPVEDDPTPFHRTGVMSKMVSLTAPYNPFNKVKA